MHRVLYNQYTISKTKGYRLVFRESQSFELTFNGLSVVEAFKRKWNYQIFGMLRWDKICHYSQDAGLFGIP